jgi:hypothetical protein
VTSDSLARSYLLKAQKRLKALAVLCEEDAHSDVVREAAQELVELRHPLGDRDRAAEVPRRRDKPSADAQADGPRVAEIPKRLRRARELTLEGNHAQASSALQTTGVEVDSTPVAPQGTGITPGLHVILAIVYGSGALQDPGSVRKHSRPVPLIVDRSRVIASVNTVVFSMSIPVPKSDIWSLSELPHAWPCIHQFLGKPV